MAGLEYVEEVQYKGKQLEQYTALVELRQSLIEDNEMISDVSLNTNKGAGEDMADIGSDNFTQQIGLSLLSDESRKFKLIEAALVRLREGTYGTCIDSGDEIEPARLVAIPYAQRCLKSQEVYEKKKAAGLLEDDE